MPGLLCSARGLWQLAAPVDDFDENNRFFAGLVRLRGFATDVPTQSRWDHGPTFTQRARDLE